MLLEHEAVADAAAVGITVNGEEFPRAYVVLQPAAIGKVTETMVQEFVSDKIAKHKRLAGGVRFVDAIPKLASGKIVRKIIREWARQDAGMRRGTDTARL